MNYDIKLLRRRTELSQTAFAEKFHIPVSTLRKWEQGEASPPSYVVELLAKQLPAASGSLPPIHGTHGDYWYDAAAGMIYDNQGNGIRTDADFSEVHPENLAIYADDLFQDFYALQKRFDGDCAADKKYDIIWERKS